MIQPKKVLMVGVDVTTPGGMTAVQQIYRKYWDNERYPLLYIGVFREGSAWIKIWWAIRGFLIFLRYLIFWQPQIIHVHFSWRGSVYRKSLFMLTGRLFGKVILAHAHAHEFESFYRRQPALARAYIRFVFRRVTGLIALSQHWKDYFKRFVPESKIFILYNPAEIPENQIIEREKLIALFLGELGERKGVYDLLKAIPAVITAHPEVKVYLCGNGEIEQVTEIVESNNLSRNVQIKGWVSGAEKDQLLREASIFILPSYSEGLPVAVIEAMMYRVAVITTPVGSIRDLFTPEEHLLLVEAGNIDQISMALQRLLSDDAERTQLAENAFEMASTQFSPDVILAQLYAFYHRFDADTHDAAGQPAK